MDMDMAGETETETETQAEETMRWLCALRTGRDGWSEEFKYPHTTFALLFSTVPCYALLCSALLRMARHGMAWHNAQGRDGILERANPKRKEQSHTGRWKKQLPNKTKHTNLQR
ncbi:hypothetical protein CLAIMM_02653 isoform 1, partial [Cladophialophora immunda]